MARQENSLRPSAMRDSGNFSKITEAMCTESTNRFVTGQRREEYYEGKNKLHKINVNRNVEDIFKDIVEVCND